jgi:hypothetical protein
MKSEHSGISATLNNRQGAMALRPGVLATERITVTVSVGSVYFKLGLPYTHTTGHPISGAPKVLRR